MPTFGEYETVGEALAITEEGGHVTTVWKARKSESLEARFYLVKCYAPRRQTLTRGQPEDALQGDRALEFLAGIRDFKKAQSKGARCLAPVHALGLAPEGAWYATDFYERGTLKDFIGKHGHPDSAMLRHIVHSVATGCLELKRSRDPAQYSHGNLKPSNVLLAGKLRPLRKTPLHLTDPHPSPVQLAGLDAEERRTVGELLGQVVEVQDLRAIGELIFQLVEGRLISSVDYYPYPVDRSERWDKLGKDGEFWRGLCNRLLDPKLSLEAESLEKLEKEFRPRPVHDNLPAIAGAVGVICLVGAGVYLVYRAVFPPVPLPPAGSLTLTVTAEDKSRAYGDPNPPLTGTVSGLREEDGIKVVYSTTADPNSQAGAYEIVPVLKGPRKRLAIYTVVTNKGTLAVTPRRLVVTADKQTRGYGTSNPDLTGTKEGLLKEDGIQVSYRTEASASSAAGQYDIVPVLIDPNQKLRNYQVTTNTGRLTVTQVELTVSADSKSRYEGETNPPLTGSMSGVRNNDAITNKFYTEATASSPAGRYDIVPVLIDPRDKLGNYIVITNKGTLTVSPRGRPPLIITANNQKRPYGTPNPPLTGTTNGLQPGDRITVSFGTTALESSAVGAYDILPEIGDPDKKLGNYTVVPNKGTLTITAAALTVAATNQSRAYGTTSPLLSAWVTPNRDGISATNSTRADVSSPAGQYDIVPVLVDPHGKLTNYTVTTSKGILTITPAPLTVTASNLSRPFGAANPPLTGWISQNRDGITATYWTKANSNSAAGNYDIIPVLADPNKRLRNYEVSTNKGTLTVNAGPRSPAGRPNRSVLGIEFAWIGTLGTNKSGPYGAYVAVSELSGREYSNLCVQCKANFTSDHYLDKKFANETLPADFDNWNDALNFLNAVNRGTAPLKGKFRCPSLEEYRSLAGGRVVYTKGDLQARDEYVSIPARTGRELPRPTTLGKLGDSGLRDLLGNVVEWTAEGKRFGVSYLAFIGRNGVNLTNPAVMEHDPFGLRLVYEE